MTPSRTTFAATALLALAALWLAACGAGDSTPPEARWDARGLSETVQDIPFQPSIISASIAVGPSRLALALVDRQDGALVGDAQVAMRLYRLADNPDQDPTTADPAGEHQMVARGIDLNVTAPSGGNGANFNAPPPDNRTVSLTPAGPGVPVLPAHDGHDHDLTTVYTATAAFDRSGWWGAEFDITAGDKTYRNVRLRFFVQERPSEPAIGEPAPRSRQLTLRDVDDIAQVSTALVPNPALVEKTIEEALDTGRPVVIAFVTPAFCQTRFCGPVLEQVVEPAWEQYRDRVEFVHVEPFDIERARTQGALEPVAVVREWGLQVEPFIFVVDAQGLVAAKLDGITDLAELSAAIEAVLGR